MDGMPASAPGPAPAATWDWPVTSDRVTYSAGWHALVGEPEAPTTESLHAWLGRVHPDVELAGRDVHLTRVAVADKRDGAALGRLRGDVADGRAARAAAEPAVGD